MSAAKDYILDRVPPQSLEAEQCALGSMMLSTSANEFYLIRRHLRSDDFYSADNGILFEILCQLHDGGIAVDAVTVRERLLKRGLLEEIGGTSHLGTILGSVPSAAHGEHYARIVQQNSRLRKCIETANDLIRDAHSRNADDVEQLVNRAIARLTNITSDGNGNKVHSIGDVAIEVYERLERQDIRRVPSGMKGLDSVIGGWPIGGFAMMAARPGMGKSLVLKQTLLNIARTGVPVGVVSIEETREKIGENILSAISGVENGRISRGEMKREDWQRIAHAINDAAALPFFVVDSAFTIDAVESAITSLAIVHKCKVIVVDYLQLIDGDEGNENREITLISRRLKAAFKRFNVAGIAAVQLNRQSEATESKRPSLRCLRGSGSLEQDGDVIILLHSDDYYRRMSGETYRDGKLLLSVQKNKSGPLGDVPMRAQLNTQTVEDFHVGDEATTV